MLLRDQSTPEDQTVADNKSQRVPDWAPIVLWLAAGVTVAWIGVVSWATLDVLTRLLA
jgi:hypothetical protein